VVSLWHVRVRAASHNCIAAGKCRSGQLLQHVHVCFVRHKRQGLGVHISATVPTGAMDVEANVHHPKGKCKLLQPHVPGLPPISSACRLPNGHNTHSS